jgi:ATP phosphoribosyltransferase
MLRIAVPNKGALAAPSSQLLADAGYHARRDGAELVVSDSVNDVEFFYLRPRDVALYVGSGMLDVGITGRDLLIDSGAAAEELMALGFGRASFRYAAPDGTLSSLDEIAGRRVATSFPGLVEADLTRRGLQATIVRLDGAVETAVRLGVADAIADVVETGRSLRASGLSPVGEPILTSEAVLVVKRGTGLGREHERLLRRIQGVQVAARYVLMYYDVPSGLADKACEITPGFESPTISPLRSDGWCAINVMVLRTDVNRTMDDLWDIGARGIIVTPIQACRL